MTDTPNGEYLTPAEVAKLLNVSRQTVLKLINDGTIPAMRLGPRTFRVRRDALDELEVAS